MTTNFNDGLLSSVLAVTGGHSIDGRLAVLRVLKTLGVRVMALASKCSTDWLVTLAYLINKKITINVILKHLKFTF